MRQDERESLSHIVQSIDEQEIFLEFVAKSENIKEAWQIARIFDSKKSEFLNSLKKYDSLIKAKEKELSSITNEIGSANSLLEEANKELESIKIQLVEMQNKAKFYKNKINQGRTIKESMLEAEMSSVSGDTENDDLLDIGAFIRDFSPLSIVDVHVKNGNTARARVAQRVYSDNLYETYKRAGLRLLKLKDRIADLELANSKLEIELRDLVSEDNFKENVLSKISASPFNASDLSIELDDSNVETTKGNVKHEIDQNRETIKEIVLDLKSVFREEGIKDVHHASSEENIRKRTRT